MGPIRTTGFLQLLSFAHHCMDALPGGFKLAPRTIILCSSR